MPPKIHERFRWAVQQLELQSHDRVLEIGCGHGAAATLVCDRLTTGHLTAIDRSDKMIAIASERNRDCLNAGKATFKTLALEDAAFNASAFDQIFAFNVNLFWTEPGIGLDSIRRWLAPGGAFALFYMPPEATWMSYYADSLSATLEAHGFTTMDVRTQPLDKSAVLAVMARAAVKQS